MSRRIALSCSPLPLALAALPACNSGKPTGVGRADRPKVAFVSNNPESFWTIAEAGCQQGRRRGRRRARLPASPTSGDAAEQKEIIDSLAQPGRQGHRRQRHRPEEPDRLPRRDRRQGAAADRGQRRPRQQAALLHRHRQLRGRPGRRQAGQGGAARRRHGRHLRRPARGRSTPASAARACSTSWPAARPRPTSTTSSPRPTARRTASTSCTRPTPTSPRASRRPRRTPTDALTELAERDERLPGRPVGVQPAGDPQRRQGPGQARQGQDRRLRRGRRTRSTASRTGTSTRTVVQDPFDFGYRVGQDDGGAGQGRQVERARPTASATSRTGSSPRTAAATGSAEVPRRLEKTDGAETVTQRLESSEGS